MMNQGKQTRLTSAEIAQLWAQYMTDSASICIFSHFAEKADDHEIKAVVKYALKLSKTHIEKVALLCRQDKHAVPSGFKVEEDVDLSAPKLYTDDFIIEFIHQTARAGLTSYGAALSLALRDDITKHFMDCLSETMQLYKMAKELLVSKGLYIKSPTIPEMKEVDHVSRQGFVWDVFGEKRRLNVIEITNLYADFQRNALGMATLTGFSQVASSKEIKKYLMRGVEIADKHLKLFANKLEESDLSVPTTWASEITESTTHTFSEKLMMFFTTELISLSITYYGLAVSSSPRVDLGVMYNRLSGEVQLFAEDGFNILIKNKWLEQPPMAPDREKLAKKKN